jgi:acyl carrier protein
MDPLVELFSRVLEIETSKITEESSPDSLPEWDSLKFMQLVAEFEQVFNRSLNISEIMSIKKLSDFRALIN